MALRNEDIELLGKMTRRRVFPHEIDMKETPDPDGIVVHEMSITDRFLAQVVLELQNELSATNQLVTKLLNED